MLPERAEDYRIEYIPVRPHEAIAWNRPEEVHQGLADPTTLHLKPRKTFQLLVAGHAAPLVEPEKPELPRSEHSPGSLIST